MSPELKTISKTTPGTISTSSPHSSPTQIDWFGGIEYFIVEFIFPHSGVGDSIREYMNNSAPERVCVNRIFIQLHLSVSERGGYLLLWLSLHSVILSHTHTVTSEYFFPRNFSFSFNKWSVSLIYFI